MVAADVYPNRGEDGGYSEYSTLLARFIRDARRDLKSPELPFVIGVMGVGGPTDQYGKDQLRYQKIHQNFRDAMAAPSTMPEFKGNVAAVRTENFWDHTLAKLRSRRGKVEAEARKASKEQELDRDAARELRMELFDAEFSDQEKLEMEKGISNAEYHYLGSATILCQAGEGFAKAMHELVAGSEKAPSVR